MPLYWKDGHLLWGYDGHLAWSKFCCRCPRTAGCVGGPHGSLPVQCGNHVIATISDGSGSMLTGKCLFHPPVVPQMDCVGAPITQVLGQGNKCTFMNGSWELFDGDLCTAKWGLHQCTSQFHWGFCAINCTNGDGAGGVQAYMFWPPGGTAPKWGAVVYSNFSCSPSNGAILSIYLATYESADMPIVGGSYFNSIGTFTLSPVSIGYNPSFPAGVPCTAPTSVTITSG